MTGRSAEVRETHRGVRVYVGNQVHRMEYRTYHMRGWLIGSGPVEAADEQVVDHLRKGTGMR